MNETKASRSRGGRVTRKDSAAARSGRRQREKYRARTPEEVAAKRAELRPDGRKRCFECGLTMSLHRFAPDSNRPDGLSAQCTLCSTSRALRRHRGLHETSLGYWWRQQFEATYHDCADCGRVLTYRSVDYDHVVGEKEFEISRFLDRSDTPENRRRLCEELLKCETVCPTCHRERTSQRAESKFYEAATTRYRALVRLERMKENQTRRENPHAIPIE